jgi:fructose-1,6-bisphosphatase/inositol monophosphatase family enzyme
MLGSGSVELASVAAGRLGAWLQRNPPHWDWLPGAALVTAAGGQVEVVSHRGQRWHIAGNGRAVAELRRLLIEYPVTE